MDLLPSPTPALGLGLSPVPGLARAAKLIGRQAPCIRGDPSPASLRVQGGMSNTPIQAWDIVIYLREKSLWGERGPVRSRKDSNFASCPEFTKCRYLGAVSSKGGPAISSLGLHARAFQRPRDCHCRCRGP